MSFVLQACFVYCICIYIYLEGFIIKIVLYLTLIINSLNTTRTWIWLHLNFAYNIQSTSSSCLYLGKWIARFVTDNESKQNSIYIQEISDLIGAKLGEMIYSQKYSREPRTIVWSSMGHMPLTFSGMLRNFFTTQMELIMPQRDEQRQIFNRNRNPMLHTYVYFVFNFMWHLIALDGSGFLGFLVP